MKKYTEIYYKTLDYPLDPDVFIECECCGSKAVDIHHIENRSHRKDLENDINNIMALCRNCHEKYGDKKQYMDWLKETHQIFLFNKLK